MLCSYAELILYCATLHYMAEILTIFGSFFGRNDDFINSFWNLLTFSRFEWRWKTRLKKAFRPLSCALNDKWFIYSGPGRSFVALREKVCLLYTCKFNGRFEDENKIENSFQAKRLYIQWITNDSFILVLVNLLLPLEIKVCM